MRGQRALSRSALTRCERNDVHDCAPCWTARPNGSDGVGSIKRDLSSELCKPTAILEQMLQAVAHKTALRAEQLYRRSGVQNPAELGQILLGSLPGIAEPLPREVLHATQQDRDAFRKRGKAG